jgi:AraC family transcriptional regulator, regulatory protein of adaptative response / methylated-DNA-[protein]-cysteine methyltransferase
MVIAKKDGLTMSDYDRIAAAIRYLNENLSRQPGLDELARHVNLSPFHFQRLFCRWAGISPKKMLQVLTLARGKELLARSLPLLHVSEELGLSSNSRLHDHFVSIEAMTPGEYKSGGEGLNIDWGIHHSPFGPMFMAITARGICRLEFIENMSTDATPLALLQLQADLPAASLRRSEETTKCYADAIFLSGTTSGEVFRVHVLGSSFQVAVWRALLNIPPTQLVSYMQVAQMVGRPGAHRAVSNAIGANPVAMLIPCHRVIRQSGGLGGYRWGVDRKRMIQLWEHAQTL